ncbi:MAG: neutral/alkaline non-lysosomal ceramidase N-terminal domain-containing protein [Prosthecobacter sp.]
MNKVLLPVVLLLMSAAPAVTAAPAPAPPTGWKAGAASVDITPTHPVRLSGYGNRTEECAQVAYRLHASALALQWQKDAAALIVTVDNCGVPAALRTEVLKRLAAAGSPVADERFALHSTHTHCAPMLKGVLPFLFGADLSAEHQEHVDQYTEDLTAKIVQAVTTALGKMEAAKLDWGSGRAYFAFNRRLKTPTGFQNAQNFSGPTDRALPVLRVKSADGQRLIATHASYACHCTTLGENEIHGDWAGMAQAEMNLRFPGSVCLFAIGCGADQNPYPRRETRFVMEHGIEAAKQIVSAINKPMRALTGPLNCATSHVELPFDKLPTTEEWQARTADKNKWVAHHARKHLEMLGRGERIPTALPYMVQVWNYGTDLLTINLPGEVVVDYSLRFKREFDEARTWVNGYTNDVPCYIPSQRVWEEGGYEAAGAMTYYGRPTRFASGIETIISGAVKSLVPEEFISRRLQPAPLPLGDNFISGE